MELISIVVPVYKVEPYLDKCVSSIVNQTYKNLEIILVDDGSPDNCPAMCDAWAEKDNRIRVIHKPNGGLSDARNAGMSVATGELMAFVDSDDWIAPDMYEKLYHHLTEDGSDIAACGVQMVWENDTPPRLLTRPGSRTLNRDEAMQAIIEGHGSSNPSGTSFINQNWFGIFAFLLESTMRTFSGAIRPWERLVKYQFRTMSDIIIFSVAGALWARDTQ